jgi:hypothetical protein
MWNDDVIKGEINALRRNIQTWAEQNDLWRDAGFATYETHINGEPGELPVALILWYEGPLRSVIEGSWDDDLQSQFAELVERHGFQFEPNDHVSTWFFPDELDDRRTAAYASYFRWQWVCSLIRDDCADVYEELYDHFAGRPEELQKLDWRQFEILLFRIFQNQGFVAELGPGRGDGGVDVRLMRGPLGDIHTLVQAKRYAPKNKIGLEPVAALRGVVANEGAPHGLFVTTSDYLPGARAFAARSSGVITLSSSADVAAWCRAAGEAIVSDKSTLVSKEAVTGLISAMHRNPDARLVHANTGYTIITNQFALVIKETKYAALLMAVPSTVVSDDGYGQRGFEVPELNEESLGRLAKDFVWRASRTVHDGRVTYWDGRHTYSAWNGKACHFDLCD